MGLIKRKRADRFTSPDHSSSVTMWLPLSRAARGGCLANCQAPTESNGAWLGHAWNDFMGVSSHGHATFRGSGGRVCIDR